VLHGVSSLPSPYLIRVCTYMRLHWLPQSIQRHRAVETHSACWHSVKSQTWIIRGNRTATNTHWRTCASTVSTTGYPQLYDHPIGLNWNGINACKYRYHLWCRHKPWDILRWSFLLNPQLTQCSRVLTQKLTGPQLLKKFPAFYGTRRFITAFTRARHLSLSCARLIQSMTPTQPLAGPF
jgi:hypothetical protein